MDNAQRKDPDACNSTCDPRNQPGPVREAGGTTGAGNLSPGSADRTGGATSGVDPAASPLDPPKLAPETDRRAARKAGQMKVE